MKFRYLLVLLLALGIINASAQDLYMPRNVKLAYKAGLRSKDGKPNAAYFQNSSTHNIRLFVSPPSRRVVGTQDIVFKNSSPIALPALFFRLELNAHAPEAPREKYMDEAWLTDDIQIDEYAENGKVRPWSPLLKIKGATANAVFLEKPLAPGQSITLSFRWHYDLSVKSDREGAIDPTTFSSCAGRTATAGRSSARSSACRCPPFRFRMRTKVVTARRFPRSSCAHRRTGHSFERFTEFR